jgi:hypothetical protein
LIRTQDAARRPLRSDAARNREQLLVVVIVSADGTPSMPAIAFAPTPPR